MTKSKILDNADEPYVLASDMEIVCRKAALSAMQQYADQETSSLRNQLSEKEIALHDTRIALNEVIKILSTKELSEKHKERLAAAKGILVKHFKITDILRNDALNPEQKESKTPSS